MNYVQAAVITGSNLAQNWTNNHRRQLFYL